MTKIFYKIKLLSLFIGAVFMEKTTTAQSNVTIDASQVFSNFKFINSDGTIDKSYQSLTSGAYSVGYRYFNDKGLLLRGSIGMRKGGATMVYDATNYSWHLQYADVKLGVGYLHQFGRISPYVNVSGYYAMLLTANQVLNNVNYDIKKSKYLKNSDYGIFATPGVQFKASDNISVYGEFNYMMGLQNLETADNAQKSYNRAYSVSLGVAFAIGEKKSK